MKIEFGFQPGHSEDMTLVACFATAFEAQKARFALTRFLSECFSIEEVKKEMEEKLGEKASEEYEEFARKRLCEPYGDDMLQLDWDKGDAWIGIVDNKVRFKVYTAGYGIEGIERFLQKQGATMEEEESYDEWQIQNLMEFFEGEVIGKLGTGSQKTRKRK